MLMSPESGTLKIPLVTTGDIKGGVRKAGVQPLHLKKTPLPCYPDIDVCLSCDYPALPEDQETLETRYGFCQTCIDSGRMDIWWKLIDVDLYRYKEEE